MWICSLHFVFVLLITEGVAHKSMQQEFSKHIKDKPECVKLGPCSCRLPNGVIDLTPVADKTTARFKDVPDTHFADYYSWNPCYNFTESANCTGVAACQKDWSNATKNIGTQDTARFAYIETGDLTVQYTHLDPSGVNGTTIVTLTCDPNTDYEIGIVGEMSDFQYSLTLTSRYCCPLTLP